MQSMGSVKPVYGSQWASTGSLVQSMESLQAVYSSLQAVHGNLVQRMESVQAVYSSLVQSRVDYRQSRQSCAVYGQSIGGLGYLSAVYGQSTGSLGKSTSCLR